MTAALWRSDVAAALRGTSLFGRIVRLVLLIVALFAMLDLGLVILNYAADREELGQDLLSKRARQIEHRLNGVPAPITGDPHPSFQVVDRSGRLIAASGAMDTLPRTVPEPGLETETRQSRNGPHFVVEGLRRITVRGQPAWIRLRLEGTGFRPFLPVIGDEIVDHVVMPLIPLTALMLVLSLGLVRRVLMPLRTAVNEVETLDPSRTGGRLGIPDGAEEIAVLTAAINGALDRMEQAMTTLRQFTADAAHELRTPLSILALEVEQIPDSDPAVARARQKLMADIAGMTRLVGQMLDLARAEALVPGTGTAVDLTAVARGVVTGLVPLAAAEGKGVRFDASGPVEVSGHAEALARALRNIVENAIRFTPPGTEVEVTVGPGPHCVVRDHGPGIPPEMRGRVFERYHRGSPGGTGLGLGIAQAIVKAHGGAITIGDAEDGGAVLTIGLNGPTS